MPTRHSTAPQLSRVMFFALIQAHHATTPSSATNYTCSYMLSSCCLLTELEPFCFDHVVCQIMHSMCTLTDLAHLVMQPLRCTCSLHDETKVHVLMHGLNLDFM